jgi:glyoxylase-like metal-dependent hydrolase (beta-lactamase superfamily II)
MAAFLFALLLAGADAPHGVFHQEAGAPATLHVHTSPATLATSYLLECKEGAVVVSALPVSEGADLRRAVDELHKPLLAVLLTDVHPDHVGALPALLADQPAPVPVVATAGVLQALGSVAADAARPAKNGQTLAFGSLRLTAHDASPAEGGPQTIWVLLEKRPAAFTGDVVAPAVHGDLSRGNSAKWLAQVQAAKRLLYGVPRVLPGRGAPGGYALLEQQRAWIEGYRDAVAALAQGRPQLSAEGKAELRARMEKLAPQAGLPERIAAGADAVAAELVAEQKSHAR